MNMTLSWVMTLWRGGWGKGKARRIKGRQEGQVSRMAVLYREGHLGKQEERREGLEVGNFRALTIDRGCSRRELRVAPASGECIPGVCTLQWPTSLLYFLPLC